MAEETANVGDAPSDSAGDAPEEVRDNKSNAKDEAGKKPDPVRRFTKIIVIVVACLFLWYVMADRLAPWTDQARVQAFVIPVVPEVSGRILEVNVRQDQAVQAGDVLLKIDPVDYELAVQTARFELELVSQEIGADAASVVNAQAKLVEARANLTHMEVQGKRIFEVERKGIIPKSEGDKARAAIKQAKAQVDSARVNLEKTKQELGTKGEKNPKFRKAIAALKQAQIDLARTTIYAPSKGGITNLKIDVGHYASAGVPVMTFIESQNVWIQANLRENSVANVKVGDPVEITLDVASGCIFKGTLAWKAQILHPTLFCV